MSQATVEPVPARTPSGKGRPPSVQGRRALLLSFARALAALVLVVILGLIWNADGAFFQWDTHRDMLRQVSVIGIIACGLTVVIITGGIDLSVGSLLALSAVLFSLLSMHKGWGAVPAVASCLALGTLLGGVSGTLVARFRIQAFIATLSMMVFARGIGKWISEGQKVSQSLQLPDGSFTFVEAPFLFSALDRALFGGNLAAVTLVFVSSLFLCWIVLSKLRWGRYLYAIGGNEDATRLSGAPVTATKIFAYALSGFLAALAGICQAAQEKQGDPEAGIAYELYAIAMVVIGGTSLNGGRGSIWLTLVGALTYGYLDKILSINAVGEASRLMLTGAIIVGAVLFQKSRK